MKRLLAAIAIAIAALAASAAGSPTGELDADAPISVRHDVLAYRISRGDSPTQACAAVVRYFGGTCRYEKPAYYVADAPPPYMTFYALIELEN